MICDVFVELRLGDQNALHQIFMDAGLDVRALRSAGGSAPIGYKGDASIVEGNGRTF
jgi:hypothetical protein